jgi:hypothetical protein
MGTLVGRNGALPEILPYLANEHRIYLDDSQRSHESRCIEQWQGQYKGLVVEEAKNVFGLARIMATDVSA